LITGLIAARSLGPAGRGELAAIVVWTNVLLYAGTLGLPEAVAYFAAADRGARARIWITGQAGALALGVAVTIIGWWLIGIAMYDSPVRAEATRWFLVFFAVPCLGSLCAGSWLQGAGFVHWFNVSRSSVHVVNAAGMVVLAAFGATRVEYFAAVLLVGNAVGWLVGAALGLRAQAFARRPSRDLAARMLQYGIRVQMGNWSNAASVRLDQLFLSIFASAASLGLYVVAVTYANVLMVIAGSASLVMLPRIVRQHHSGTARECLEPWYRRVFWTTVAGATVMGVSALYVVPLLFGSSFVGAVPLVLLLVPATIVLGMNLVLSTAFRGVGRPDVASKAELAGLVVTCVGLAVLLPRYGVYGAAVASLVAYASIHAYMAAKVRDIFGTNFKVLYVPRHDDLTALRHVLVDARLFLTRARTERRIGAQEL
jgi:O-antigen/teichoic acid export membrane protein